MLLTSLFLFQDATIKFYLQHGASRDKLVLGIPTYGRSYTLANPDAHGISSPATGPGDQGPGTKEDGYLAYYEICEKILEEGWDLVTPYPGIMGPYAHKDNQWVTFFFKYTVCPTKKITSFQVFMAIHIEKMAI